MATPRPLRPRTPDAYTPPPVSNYDAAGPVANTATAVPVPPAYEEPAIDEAAEEAAAAAEAANIGGTVSDYAGPDGELADEAERPLAEAGEGESEGQEQTEDELREAAESTEGMSPEEHQIDDAIEAASNPPETVEPVKPGDDSEWNTWSGRSVQPVDANVRLGFAVKVLGEGGLPSHDARRWQSGPHLRHSLEHLTAILEYLGRHEIRMYRMTSDLAPYATHPDLPQFHGQVEECADELARVGALARELDIRLSSTPGSTSS